MKADRNRDKATELFIFSWKRPRSREHRGDRLRTAKAPPSDRSRRRAWPTQRSRTSGSARCRTGRRSSPAAGEAASSRCATIQLDPPLRKPLQMRKLHMLVVVAGYHLSADHRGRHGADAATRRRGAGVAPALAPDGVPMRRPERKTYEWSLRSCWHLGCSWSVPWAVPRVPARVPAASLRQQVTRNASATPTFRNILCTRVMLSRLVALSVLLT